MDLYSQQMTIFLVSFTFLNDFSLVDLHDDIKSGCWEICDTTAKPLQPFFVCINIVGPVECHVRRRRVASCEGHGRTGSASG